MRRWYILCLVVSTAVMLARCTTEEPLPSDDAGTEAPVDGGEPSDGGDDAGEDAGLDGGLDAGTDAGVDSGCVVYSSFPTDTPFGFYDENSETTVGVLYEPDPSSSPDGGHEKVVVRVHHPDDASVPLPFPLTYSETSKFTGCTVCLSMFRGCDTGGVCDYGMAPTAGAFTVTVADRDAGPGALVATGSNLRFRRWDFQADLPVDGGLCIDVTTLDVNVGWQ